MHSALRLLVACPWLIGVYLHPIGDVFKLAALVAFADGGISVPADHQCVPIIHILVAADDPILGICFRAGLGCFNVDDLVAKV